MRFMLQLGRDRLLPRCEQRIWLTSRVHTQSGFFPQSKKNACSPNCECMHVCVYKPMSRFYRYSVYSSNIETIGSWMGDDFSPFWFLFGFLFLLPFLSCFYFLVMNKDSLFHLGGFLCPDGPMESSLWRSMNVFQVWAWKENVWEKEKGTLMERYTVEQSKPPSQGGAVLSTLTINNVMESDFHSPYNCTAWNSFGPGTMIITLEEKGMEGTGGIT